MKHEPSLEDIVWVTLNCLIIRMTQLKQKDRVAIYQEFKEWIESEKDTNFTQEILCLKYNKIP